MGGKNLLKKEDMPECHIATTVQIIGSKWKLLIIRDLSTGPKRTSELKKSLNGVSQKVLTESLKGLISDGIVERIDFNEKPLHVEYRLTDIGETLKPVLQMMKEWGAWYKNTLE